MQDDNLDGAEAKAACENDENEAERGERIRRAREKAGYHPPGEERHKATADQSVTRLLPPLPRIKCYHIHSKNKYLYFNELEGDWQFLSAQSLEIELRQMGYNHQPPKGGGLPETKVEMRRIEKEQSIDGAAAIGWLTPGVQDIEGSKILVTRGANLIEPEEIDWDRIRDILAQMLLQPEKDFEEDISKVNQLDYFLSALSLSAKALYGQIPKLPGPAIVLCGPRNCGKTLIQDLLITPVLGGRVGKPWEWLTGVTQFNSELFEACHQVIDDEASHGDFKARKKFGDAIKRLTAVSSQKLQEKGLPSFTAKPFWRLSISLNDGPDNIAVLPTLEESLQDKMLLFKCLPRVTSWGSKKELQEIFREELPGFLYYLLYLHEVPASIWSERYGVKGYVHPFMKDGLETIGEEKILLEFLEMLYPSNVSWSTAQLMSDIDRNRPPKALKYTVEHINKFFATMKELAKTDPRIAYKKETSGVNRNKWLWHLAFRDEKR